MIKKIFNFLNRYSVGRNEFIRETPNVPTKEGLKRFRERLREPLKRGPSEELMKALSTKKEPIKIAVDESIGQNLTQKLIDRGYKVVCRAGHAEPDEVWMKRALEQKALFIISPDLDIPSMIEKENLPMIWIDYLFASNSNPTLGDQDKADKRNVWAKYLHERIQAKTKFLKEQFGESK